MQSLKLFKDPRHFQLLFQCTFLTYGVLYLHWDADWGLYATFLASAVLTQFLCECLFAGMKTQRFSAAWWQKLKAGLPSAIISSFGLALFLKTNDAFIAASASVIAILSKYLVRVNGKHIFNPSAFGIVATVLLTDKAWVNPGQWGSGVVLLLGILTLGVIVVTRVQQLDVSLAFLGTFASLLFARQVLYLHWPMDFFVQTVSTGSVLVFSFFMISDPKTTPNHSGARIAWAVGVGAAAFYFATFRFVVGAPVYVLVFAQLLVPVIDMLFKGRSFTWQYSNPVLHKEIFHV